MKFIRKCPVLVILISTGLLFTIIGIAGKSSIYADQKYDPVTTPIMSVMFTGLNDEIYPWQIFTDKTSEVMAQNTVKTVQDSEPSGETENVDVTNADEKSDMADDSETAVSTSPASTPGTVSTPLPEEANVPESGQIAEEAESKFPQERPTPLRESTYEEYVNHISADIYGDTGVLRAAEYEFETVDESYFDDALFIGDSRTVGLRDYTDLSEHADFYCETSLTIYKVMEENFKGQGTIEEALANRDYGRIYLMVGINELGRGTTEDFMEQYTEVVDTIHQLEPEAKIFIQGIMRVSGEKNSSDAIFNNNNINARNNAIATLADNKQFFYIDVNEAVCDEEGNLNAEYTFDQIHLLGVYNDLWKQFLMEHGVADK